MATGQKVKEALDAAIAAHVAAHHSTLEAAGLDSESAGVAPSGADAELDVLGEGDDDG